MATLNDTIKYLNLSGLTAYDILIKKYSDDNDAILDAKIDAAIGNGGSITTQIEAAINNLKGTLSNSDADTLEEINDELDSIDSILETLNGNDTTAGSVAKSIKDGINAIGTGTAQGETGKAITSITQTNGVVTATAGTVSAQYVTTNFTGASPVSATSNVQASLEEIYGLINSNEVTVWTDINGTPTQVSAIDEFGKTYTFKQGTNTIATMNLAKDMVVSGGSVITAAAADKAVDSNVVIGDKYIKLTIANSTDVLYIPVNSLYKDHTAAQNAQKIQLAISNDNIISANIVSGSIEKSDLTTSLQQEISSSSTVVNPKSTGHVTVAITAASGANPAQVTISENDIASAQALSAEVTRAQAAEGELAGKIGLTGNEGSRAYSSNIGGSTVIADINTLDGRVDSIETFISNITTITQQEIIALFTVSSSGN